MSVSLPSTFEAPSSSALAAARRPSWLREPLVHFLVLGGLLFALDHYLITRSSDPQSIVVGAQVDNEARQVFRTSRGRDPNAEELAALRRVWLDNEVLYREGIAMQLDKGDPTIRDRVIFKALSVVDANTKLPPVNDKLLKDWFDKHRAKYDEPPRYDFQEAVLSGEINESRTRSLVDELNSGHPGSEIEAGLRVFKGRPKSNLDLSYGPGFAKELEGATPNEWGAFKAKDGWHAIRLMALTPGKPANFDVVRNAVQQDWADGTLAEQRSAAVQALTKKYKIKYEGTGQ